MTHPFHVDAVVRQRRAELQATARASRYGRGDVPRQHATRERVGWLLVEWGLRLATSRPQH